MLASLSRYMAVRSTNYNINPALGERTRRLVTVVDDAFPRLPMISQKAAPASQQPATFTIRDEPIHSVYSFGPHRDVLGEVILTISIVGYPESLTVFQSGSKSLPLLNLYLAIMEILCVNLEMITTC